MHLKSLCLSIYLKTLLTIKTDTLDSVKNWFNELIGKNLKLVVVQIQPLQTKNATLQFDPTSFSF